MCQKQTEKAEAQISAVDPRDKPDYALASSLLCRISSGTGQASLPLKPSLHTSVTRVLIPHHRAAEITNMLQGSHGLSKKGSQDSDGLKCNLYLKARSLALSPSLNLPPPHLSH